MYNHYKRDKRILVIFLMMTSNDHLTETVFYIVHLLLVDTTLSHFLY